MFRNFNPSAVIFVIALAFSFIAVQAEIKTIPALQDLQTLKQQIAIEVKMGQAIQRSHQATNQKVKELADKRRFYQIFKSQEEKDLIATREELNKKSISSQSKVTSLQNKLRKDVSEYIANGDADYADLRKAVEKLALVANEGNLAVKQLNEALSKLGSSQVSSAINTGSSLIGVLSDQEPTALDYIAQGLNQMAVNNALKAGQKGLATAAAFDSQLQELARGNNSGIFSGSWSGAVTRGVIFALITGINPLNSNAFIVSNNFFQLRNLAEVKAKVKSALEIIIPVSESMNQELASLYEKLTLKENELISQL